MSFFDDNGFTYNPDITNQANLTVGLQNLQSTGTGTASASTTTDTAGIPPNDPATGLPQGWTGLSAGPNDTNVVKYGTAGTAINAGGTAGGQAGNFGGGWSNPTGTAAGLQQAFKLGLSGQAAVDWTNANGYSGIAYYPDSGNYGLPDGQYVAPNASNGSLDLIQRGGGGGSGAFSYPSWDQQFSYAPWTQTFTAPTGLTEQNDPGYQERMTLADTGIQNSAAANGTLLTTGTLKDLSNYNQTFASNEYGAVYGRALTDYQTALQAYQQNYNTAAQQYNQSYQQYLNGYNQAFQSYMGNFGVSNTLNQEGFQNYLSLADLGLGGVNSSNSSSGQFATNSGNNATNAGNANAAGIVGNANATTTGINNLTNNALPYLGYGGLPNYGQNGSSYRNPYESSTTVATGNLD